MHATAAESDVLPTAIARAAAVANTRGPALTAMKSWLYRDVLEGLSRI